MSDVGILGSVPWVFVSLNWMFPETGFVIPMPPAPVVLTRFGNERGAPLFTESDEPVIEVDRLRTIALVKSTMPMKFMLVGAGWVMY